MKVTILSPMEIEKEKTLMALQQFKELKHSYEVVTCGIGREAISKTMMTLPESDVTVLMGFAAVVGQAEVLPEELQLGMPVEVTASLLYGYEGQLFENGSIKVSNAKTNLPCLLSLTSDKFVKTTDITIGTLVNMEDYSFVNLKRPQDFIIRIVSDFLPHQKPIDFFKEIEVIDFTKAIEAIEKL